MAVPERIGCWWVGRDVGGMSVEWESPSVVRQLVSPLVTSHWSPSTGVAMQNERVCGQVGVRVEDGTGEWVDPRWTRSGEGTGGWVDPHSAECCGRINDRMLVCRLGCW